MLSFKKLILAFFAFTALALSPVSPSTGAARAGDPVIDAAKDKGIVGECIDGYLGLVTAADPNLKRKVDEINTLRRSFYDKLAQEEGTSTVAAARVTGESLIAKEQSGRFIFDDSGKWYRKP